MGHRHAHVGGTCGHYVTKKPRGAAYKWNREIQAAAAAAAAGSTSSATDRPRPWLADFRHLRQGGSSNAP
jgi:hypothetical protein